MSSIEDVVISELKTNQVPPPCPFYSTPRSQQAPPKPMISGSTIAGKYQRMATANLESPPRHYYTGKMKKT